MFANRYTMIYGNTLLTRGQAHGSVDSEPRGLAAERDDTNISTHSLAGLSQPDNLGPRYRSFVTSGY